MSETTERRWTGAQFLLLVACFVVVVAGLKAASSLILPFLVAVFLSMITLPLLNWLQAKRMPTPLAVTLTIIAALLVLGGIVVLVGGSIAAFTDEAPKYKERLELMSSGARDWLQAQGFSVSDQIAAYLINPAQAVDLVSGALRGVAGVLSNLLLVLLAIVFILSEAAGFPQKLRTAFGKDDGWDRFGHIRAEVQHYLGIKTLTSLVTGSIVAAALAIIGVDFPLLWGMLAFLLNYIPTFGSILAAIAPVLLASVQFGPGRAIAVALVFVAVNILIGSFIEPHFMGRRLGLSTLVVFFSLVFWGWVWGPVGMLLSVPLTMIVKIMLENTEDLKWMGVLLDRSGERPPARPGP